MHAACAAVLNLTGPIARSRLEPDFYKFTMGQLIWRKYRQVQVTFALQNRSPQARLGAVIDPGELREQLEHARSLTFTHSELHYLRGTNEYKQRMFDEDYLEFLRGLRLPPFEIERRDQELHMRFEGAWADVTYWETMALSIVSELYYRTLLRPLSPFDRQAILATGVIRLRDKIAALRADPGIRFSDFGTRRRFSAAWQHYVDATAHAGAQSRGVERPLPRNLEHVCGDDHRPGPDGHVGARTADDRRRPDRSRRA